MARKTIVMLTDDLEGGGAERTVTFSLDGTNYEIDLNHTNISNLTAALEPFISAGRKTGRGRTRQSNTPSSDSLKEVRIWGREQGFQISDRGRVPASVMKAYEQRA